MAMRRRRRGGTGRQPKRFKLSAGPEKMELPRRTRVTEMADLATHEAAVESKKEKNKGKSSSVLPPHHNGVSSASLSDADFSHVTPPYLHLVLGLVSDCVKEMLAGLEKLMSRASLVAPRTVDRSFLLELERDETAQRAERMKENMKTAVIT